jgi:Tfp pilus assembly protein PilO
MSKSSAVLEPVVEAAPARRDVWRSIILPVLLVVLALVNALVFALALKPAGVRTREQRDVLQRLQDEHQSRRAAIARLRDIVSQLDVSRKEAAAFYQEKFLPRNDGFSVVMEELDKLAHANQVQKGGVAYALNDVQGRPDLGEVDITTTVEGEYARVVQFVNQIERDRLFLLIDSITVAAGGPAPGQPRQVRLSVRLVTFFKQ